MDAETQASIAQLTARLETVQRNAAERIRWLSEQHEAEWRDAAAWRSQWTAELDALEFEVGLLKLTLEQHIMPDRNAILGDELTQTIDKINAVVRDKVPPAWAQDVDVLFRLFGDFWAHTLGRATVLAAGAVRAVDEKVEAVADRVTQLEKQVGDDGSH
jgi:hypothetical protein